MSLRALVLIDPSSESLSVDISSIEDEFYLSSFVLGLFSNKFPSSKCAKFIMSKVCSWHDVSYEIYNTSGFISSASEYVCDVYDNTLENVLANTTSCEGNVFCVLGT